MRLILALVVDVLNDFREEDEDDEDDEALSYCDVVLSLSRASGEAILGTQR